MKKLLAIVLTLTLTLSLVGCGNVEVELVDGDSIELKRGEEYVEPGIKVDGELNTEFTITDDIDNTTLGTYTVTYKHDDYDTVTRTVTVVKNDTDILKDAIDATMAAPNFTCTEDYDIDLHGPGGAVDLYFDGWTNISDGIGYAEMSTDLMTGSPESMKGYIQFEGSTAGVFLMIGSGPGYVYTEEEVGEELVCTSFDLSEIVVSDFEVNGDVTTYTVELNADAVSSEYKDAHVVLGGSEIAPNANKVFEAEMTVENNLVASFTLDLAPYLTDYYESLWQVVVDNYIIEYTFSNYGEVDPIVIPSDVLEYKN